MRFLSQDISFPDVNLATKDGLLAVGGDLSPERLVSAYKKGIFPWYSDEEPILWWSPDPRFVLYPNKLKVSKSMRKLFRDKPFKVTFNTNFEQVISQCAQHPRPGQDSTWITNEMKRSYMKLHELGYAISVEVWQNEELVGGLYGVDVRNGVFSGESMFAKVSNASKYGLISFIQQTNYNIIDCQVYTEHLYSLGAREIDRDTFINILN
ncbi:MAG: leucyl/phenylalanyl-tRNA--protein transferase [bacterium]